MPFSMTVIFSGVNGSCIDSMFPLSLIYWGGGTYSSLPSGSPDAIQMVPKIANYLVAYIEEIFCLEGRCRFLIIAKVQDLSN